MNYTKEWQSILHRMVVPPEIYQVAKPHESLWAFVSAVAERQQKAPNFGPDGDLRSSQVIALAVETWRVVKGPNAPLWQRADQPW